MARAIRSKKYIVICSKGSPELSVPKQSLTFRTARRNSLKKHKTLFVQNDHQLFELVPEGGGGALPIMAYTGSRSFRYLKVPLIITFRIDAPYGCITLFIKPYMKMRTRLCERGTFFQWKVYKRGTFSAKMVYKRVRGWTSGRSLPVLNFVKYPPSPPSGASASRLWLSLWCFSIFVTYYFQVSFNLTVILSMLTNNSKYRDAARTKLIQY